MAYGNAVTVLASGAQTATGQTPAITGANDDGQYVCLLVSVTAASGTTPTLDLKVQWSPDGTNWADPETAQTFTQITGAKNTVQRFPTLAQFYRVAYTIGLSLIHI